MYSTASIQPPLHPTRTITLLLGSGVTLSTDNVLGAQIYKVTGTVTYNLQTQMFTDPQFNFGQIPPGQYYIILHMGGFLDELLQQQDGATLFTIDPTTPLSLLSGNFSTTLIPGDVAPSPKGDNSVDILDYNAVLSCLGKPTTGTCQSADISDDGVVDQIDLAIVQANMGQTGISFVDPNYTCVQDPNCQSKQSTLQMCTLKCTRSRLNN